MRSYSLWINFSHMSFYTCFDWFKNLRLFVNERNLKMDVVLKASRAVVIRWFSLNEAPLGLFKFISDYLPYLEKINIFFNIITRKVWINLSGLIDIICFAHSKQPQSGCTHPCVTSYAGYTVSTSWLRLFLYGPNKKYCDKSLTHLVE
jgi:hypothetical protein